MKVSQPVLPTATVAALACALLVGNIVLPRYSNRASSVTETAEVAPAPVHVLVPNAQDGTKLERVEYPRGEDQRAGPAIATRAIEPIALTEEPAELAEDELMAALNGDLETWELEPVQVGGTLGPEKATVLLAKNKQESSDLESPSLSEDYFMAALDNDVESWEQEALQLGGALGPQKSAVVYRGKNKHAFATAEAPSWTEDDFMSALDQDLEPWEREPVQVGGPMGPQKSSVLIAKGKYASGL